MKSEICESPRLRDFACERGCFVRLLHMEDEFGQCNGTIEPHHEPFVSQGGDDLDVIGGACHKHHRMRHDEDEAITFLLVEYQQEMKRSLQTAYINFIESSNGVAPAAKRGQRKSTRKNREPFSKSFVPLDQRESSSSPNEGK